VLVIGESFNRNHSSLYGYDLETSPLMERERAEGRLTVFTDVHTPTNGTDYAMRYFFTLKGCETDQADSSQYVLMPAVMKKAHYGVAYFDNQYTRSSGGSLDYSCGYFLNPTYINDHCFDYRNTETKEYDGNFISSCRKQFLTAHRSLNIIHLQGQHFNAVRRYPASHGVFSGSDIQRSDLSESQRQQVAEYDNATRYNDYVLGMIIDSFRKTDAVVIYLSDHGEQVYDGSEQNYGRAFSGEQDEETLRNVYHIPMMIWCSDSYIAHHAEQHQRIHASAGRKFCSADIPYLLFDLADVDFNHNHKDRSLIDSLFKPHETIITDY
jgi:heptose-I-phosphate ethanolaminephosphotransferase